MRLISSVIVALAALSSSVDAFYYPSNSHAHAASVLQQTHSQYAGIVDVAHNLLKNSLSLRSLYNDFDAAHFRFHEQAQQKFHILDSTNSSASSSSSGTTGPTTATCTAAYTDMKAQAAICGLVTDPTTGSPAPTTASASNTTSDPNIALANNMATVCANKDCYAQLQIKMKAAVIACQSQLDAATQVSIYSALGSMRDWRQLLQVGCIQDAKGNYCLASFLQTMAQINNKQINLGNNPLTSSVAPAALNILCTECNLKIATAIETLGSVNTVQVTASFQLVCMKDPTDPTKYCINTLAKLMNTSASASSSTTITSGTSSPSISTSISSSITTSAPIPEYVCEPCFRRILNTILSVPAAFPSATGLTSQASTITGAFDALCTINQNGDRCVTVFSKANLNVFSDPSCQTSCTTQCASLVKTNIVDATGCCLGTILKFSIDLSNSQSISKGQPTQNPSNLLNQANQAFAQCGLNNVATPCQGPSNAVTVTIVVPNFKYQFYVNNKDTADAKLKQDIAAAAGVSSSAVLIGVGDNGSGGIKMSVVITTPSASDNAAAQSTLTAQLTTGGGVAFPATAALAASNSAALVDPSQPVASGSGSSTSAASAPAGTQPDANGNGFTGAASSSAQVNLMAMASLAIAATVTAASIVF